MRLIFFVLLGRKPVSDIHTHCVILLVELQLKIQLKMLTVSTDIRSIDALPYIRS
jgi:hypothetical protein